jgi:hypothetical protein
MDTMIMYDKRSRDPRLVTVRRGGTLKDSDHRLLAVWAAACADHVLHFFEQAHSGDERPRKAIEQARAWVRGEITMTQARTAAFAAHDAAREASGAAKEAARAAGHAVAVAHMAEHELGALRMPSGPSVQRQIQTIATTWVVQSASGNVRSFLLRSATLCSMISGSATGNAGPSSIADALARFWCVFGTVKYGLDQNHD